MNEGITDLVGEAFATENEGFVAIKIIAVVEALDPDGNIVLMTAFTEELPQWSAMGMLKAAQIELEEEWRMGGEMEDD